jgi:N-hydroxyarylamine O-acetyltransferase
VTGPATGPVSGSVSEGWVTAYLDRLGLPRHGQPSAEGLRAVHAAQVERVPYEVIDIQLGRPPSIEPAESVRRVLNGRGGYCYTMNGALSVLLRALGYDVRWHRGSVHKAGDRPGTEDPNHLALTVHGLPSPQNPGGAWFADSGLGDALYEPLPLREGEYDQAPFRFGLSRTAGGWQFRHDPGGSFDWMDFDYPRTAELADFTERHRSLSTSPESGFVRVCTVLRRDAAGVDILRNCLLTRTGDGAHQRTLDDRGEWFEMLDGVFGLRLDDLTIADRDQLWWRVRAAHEAWLATR